MAGVRNNPKLRDTSMWYKDAIIYQLHVRAFYDSNGDGIGDFRGLTQKLDYLEDLGVTAIWLLPFFPSPLLDDGYDIADYNNVHPSYGNLRDFRAFLREAHRRGLRVITELVINHTSDQHSWFQRSRVAKPGSRWRDFYVWNDTPNKYKEARIIFKDFERSNWTWDQEADAYFWHRFYSHQPDLNFDSANVRRAVTQVLDFWMNMGVDGVRLDAIPYLYERDGTTCENLPQTHAYLKELRKHVDENHPGRIFLAEANQWPDDSVDYFGNGDECHLAFHFPVMPRMFMSLRMEDRFPIVDIMQQTPAIPEDAQWAMFLRNHDELTLEMVTDEERDYMYRAYAADPQAKINLGIRRRLAPLLGNDRKRIELLNGLLFSLPGTPIIYYGDDIGMGDNFYLGDRNGVRTPMQWSGDRNAGFSRANPQSLYLPVIIDPEYQYESVNVENQQNNPNSLLWWMKRLISLRKRHKVFGRGSLQFLHPENRKALAFIREYEDERVLVVANLSRFTQHVQLDLSRFKGAVPVELFGLQRFMSIDEESYPLSLAPHAFHLFALEPQSTVASTGAAIGDQTPTLVVRGEWQSIFSSRDEKEALEAALPSYLLKSPWFGSKGRTILNVEIRESVPVPPESPVAYLSVLRVEYSEGEPESYSIPIAFGPVDELTESINGQTIALVSLERNGTAQNGVLYDAMADARFCNALFDLIALGRRFPQADGELVGVPTPPFRPLLTSAGDLLEPAVLNAEQRNTSVVYGDLFILKLFRRLEEGTNPDLEIGRYLTQEKNFPNIAPVAGAIEYRRSYGETTALAMLQGFLPSEGDLWQYTLDSLSLYFEDALTGRAAENSAPLTHKHIVDLSGEDTPPQASEFIGYYLETARLLGQRTGELHLVLAERSADPQFNPEPFTDFYQRSLYQGMLGATNQALQLLGRQLHRLPEDVQSDASKVLDRGDAIRDRFQGLRDRRVTAMRTRCHGDYRLGQVLNTGKDFIIIDFEGETDRPLSERRIKRSPLSDVSSMIRSFDYAAHASLIGRVAGVRPEDHSALEPWARFWHAWVSASFLRAYIAVASQGTFLPDDPGEFRVLMDVYLMEKAIKEIFYELNNRPDWAVVPIKGVLELIESDV